MPPHDEIINQVQPHDKNAEISVLGGALQDKEGAAVAVEMLVDSMRGRKFYASDHQAIFDAMVDLYDAGEAVDTITVGQRLAEVGKLDAIGSNYYLTELVACVPSAANIEYHCRIVNEKALLRALIESCQVTLTRCFDGHERVREILNQHSAEIFDFQVKKKDEWVTLADAATEAVDMLQKAKASGKEVAGVPTGFAELDELTGGLHKGDVLVVGGRPGMGKTAFMMSLAQHTAEIGYCPQIFSLEMKNIALALRALAGKARMNSQKFRLLKYITMEDIKRLAVVLSNNVETWKRISLQDTSGLTPVEMRARLKKLYARNPGMIEKSICFVDYTQIIVSGKKSQSREQDVSYVSAFLKRIAKDFDIPLVTFAQLSREVEKRGGKPILSDLRESGAIEQDADAVFFLYRDESMAEIIIGKQRNGPLGTVQLYFQKEYTSFENLAKTGQDKPNGQGLFVDNRAGDREPERWVNGAPF